MDKLQTPKEISAILRVSESTVLRMAYSGDLPYIPPRNGRRKQVIRFDPLIVQKLVGKKTKREPH